MFSPTFVSAFVCEQANSKITSWFSWFFDKIPILILLQRAYRAFPFQWESHDTTGPLGLAVTCWPVVLSKYGRLINGCGNSKWSTSSIIGRLSVKTVLPMLSDSCLSICPVSNVLWPNSCMDQDETWHGGSPRSRPHCVRLGTKFPRKGAQPPIFGPCLLWPKRLDG